MIVEETRNKKMIAHIQPLFKHHAAELAVVHTPTRQKTCPRQTAVHLVSTWLLYHQTILDNMGAKETDVNTVI